MSIVERERAEDNMPLTNETIREIAGHPQESPAEAAQRDVREIIASFQGEMSKVVSTLVCGVPHP